MEALTVVDDSDRCCLFSFVLDGIQICTALEVGEGFIRETNGDLPIAFL
jgi:hypothetical protein